MLRRTCVGLFFAVTVTPTAAALTPVLAFGQTGVENLYQFRAGQMMRFDVTYQENGELSQGFYEVSVAEGSGGQVQLRVEAQVGENACNTTSSVAPGPAVSGQMMMSCFTLAPVAAALYAPTWTMFMGQAWTVGNSWTMGNVSFEVTERCSYAGSSGVRAVMREDGEVRIDTCYDDALPLPLYVRLVTDDDGYVEMRATAVRGG